MTWSHWLNELSEQKWVYWSWEHATLKNIKDLNSATVHQLGLHIKWIKQAKWNLCQYFTNTNVKTSEESHHANMLRGEWGESIWQIEECMRRGSKCYLALRVIWQIPLQAWVGEPRVGSIDPMVGGRPNTQNHTRPIQLYPTHRAALHVDQFLAKVCILAWHCCC